jgi:signal transduction histidine kinase
VELNDTTLGLQQRLIGSHPHWWMGAMLFALHYALAWGIDDWPARAILLAHLGFFLLWQSARRGERILELRQALLVVIVGLLFAGWNNWWLMAVWLAVLVALIGGDLLGSPQPRQRLAAMLAALYLLSMLLVWVVPHLFVDQIFDPVLVLMVQFGLPLLPVVIVFMRIPQSGRSAPLSVDFIYNLMLFMLVTVLVLSSFVVKQVSHGDYPLALAQSLIVMAVVLITLSWLWNPHSGFMGIGHVLSRYLMSLGLPFERWIKGLADHAEREREPASFLALALHDIFELPWVAGVAWQASRGGGEIGARSRFHAEYSYHDLTLTFHTKWPLSPALLLHLKLLTQMLGHFYEAKLREEIQRHNAYTQAIYETGARLTHDVKNLLQALGSLCAAAEASGDDRAAALQLIQRQLPQIAQRLSTTLEKLTAVWPSGTAQIDAAAWWEKLKQRYERGDIAFAGADAMAGLSVPGELFDSVAENLLQNALAKAQQQPGLRIGVSFQPNAGGRLTICDTGKAIPHAVTTRLFAAPVPSQNGLGIGLYQAAKQAEQLGYQLTLANNTDGRVCFDLARVQS